MPDFWKSMTDGFMPHGYCLRWDGPLLLVFIVGNIGIAIAYFLIPVALRYFIGKRKDLPYGYMFKLFAAFILSCGLTHVAKVVTLYQPAYWIEAGLDLCTAGISLFTAFLLLPLIPKALQLRSPKELEEANNKLQLQIAQTQKSEGAFMSMVAAVKDYGIFILDSEGTILTWNEGAQRMKGYGANEVIGKNFSIFYTEEAQKSKHPAFELRQAVQNGSYEEEGWRVRSDGLKFWASISITPIPGGSFVKVVSDLTERKQNEQEIIKARDQALRDFEQSEDMFAQLFNLLPQLGWTAKADGFIDFYNQEWYDFTGTTYEEMQGWGWEKVHDAEMLPKVLEKWKHSIANVEPFEMKFPLKGKDGRFRWFLTRIRPMYDQNGKHVRWVGINTDIDTETRDAELLESKVHERTIELEQARDEAIRANELKTQFVANISHEIRTPMSGILGLSELLTDDCEGEAKTTAEYVHNSAVKLMALVNDLLDLSKLEAGRIDVVYEVFQIDRLVDDVITGFNLMATNKGLLISQNIDPVVLEDVEGDATLIRQVLQNLVQNAIKFTDSGFVQVDVALQSRDDNNDYVRFSVVDSGPGISEENQKKLFQMFVQVDGSTKRKFGGTGIGLSLSKKLAELMGGAIGVESIEGHGSTFWFTVPLKVCVPCKKNG